MYPDSPEARERASAHVARGGVLAFRTDTFYGLGADPFNVEALERINALKGRDGKPILVLFSDVNELMRLAAGFQTRCSEALAISLWPGALTLVMAARPEAPHLLTAYTGTVGVRLPNDEDVRAFVRACGGLLTATSANPAGRPPARTAAEAARYFPDGSVLVIDGGPARSELPSTVVDVTQPTPRLIREGVVTRAVLEAVLSEANRELD
jgi:L-threonylcarbamoyladenylate synthase